MDDDNGREEFAVMWGTFLALEDGLERDDLPDDEVDGLSDAAEEAIGSGGVFRGWHLVATLLRHHLVEHARACECGSIGWLRDQRDHYGNEV